jgi:hypothetical protein
MPLFREVQRFRQPWLWFPILAWAGWTTWALWRQIIQGVPVGSNPMGDTALLLVWALSTVGIPALFLATRLRTEVRPDGVHIRFTPFHLRDRFHPLEALVAAEAVTYRPLLEYGGWGIRVGPKGWAYNVSGNRGVRLTFADGRRLLVGSQKPEAFVDALEELWSGQDPAPSGR